MTSEKETPDHEDYSDGFRKLYLPEWCLIPKEVKKDQNLSSDEKIFFGEINVLANERGYCWGTDVEFAELKGVAERTIQRYFSNMENRGHITRETVTVPYKNHEGRLRWKKDRKIWMGKRELKKVADTPNLSTPTNPPNLAVSNEPAKSGGILTGKEKKTEKQKEPVCEFSDSVDSVTPSDEKPSEHDVDDKLRLHNMEAMQEFGCDGAMVKQYSGPNTTYDQQQVYTAMFYVHMQIKAKKVKSNKFGYLRDAIENGRCWEDNGST